MEEIKIPKGRVAVLIGKGGEIKRIIEKEGNVKLKINSEGNVEIEGENIDIFETKPVIKAIGRGFNPETACLLLDEDYCLEVLDITEFSGKSKKKLIRLRSRCIGKEGKARTNIEDMTNTEICIYGKTIAIIGRIDDVDIAKQGIISLLNGAPHGNVYKLIQKRKERTD